MYELFEVVDVKVIQDFKLYLKFDDGISGELDLYSLLTFNGVFKPLKNPENFAKVELKNGSVWWPGDVDVSPDTLHDWMLEFGTNLKQKKKVRKLKIKLAMPNISRFYGVTISMWYDEKKHNLAYFHANYENKNASIAIGTWKVVAGEIPTNLLKYVIQWAKLHQKELEDNWDLCKQRKNPKPIKPLN
jgi:hypothetical protein